MKEAEMDPKEYGKNEKVHKETKQEDRDEELWRNGENTGEKVEGGESGWSTTKGGGLFIAGEQVLK